MTTSVDMPKWTRESSYSRKKVPDQENRISGLGGDLTLWLGPIIHLARNHAPEGELVLCHAEDTDRNLS